MPDLREALGHAAGPPPPPLDVRAVQHRVAQRSHRRRVLAAAAVALPAVGLGAVIALGAGPGTQGGDVLVPGPPAASAPQTATPSLQPSPLAVPTAVPTAEPPSPEPQPSEPPVQYMAPPPERSEGASFRTPSGNIFCLLTNGQAACAIRERSWSPPPRPAECDEFNDYADHLFVESGPGSFSCGTDTPVDLNAPVLPYGQGWVIQAWRCASERTGVTCENTDTGHGFTLSRQTYRLY